MMKMFDSFGIASINLLKMAVPGELCRRRILQIVRAVRLCLCIRKTFQHLFVVGVDFSGERCCIYKTMRLQIQIGHIVD